MHVTRDILLVWFVGFGVLLAPVGSYGQTASTPYTVLDTAIDCLNDAAMSLETLENVKPTGTAIGDSLQTMTAKRSVIRRFETCRDSLERLNATGEAMITAVDGLRTAFDALIIGFQRSLKIDEKVLAASSEAELRGLIPELSEVNEFIDAAWRGVPYTTVAVTFTLVDPSRPSADNKVNRSHLTRAQFNAAMKSLQTLFPKSAKDTPNRHAVHVSANLLWQFFEQKWIAADEP